MKDHYSIPRRLGLIFGTFILLLGLAACDTGPKIPAVTNEAYQIQTMEIQQKKKIVDTTYVFIDGQDIQLPITGGKDKAVWENKKTYSFYVWAIDPEHPTNSLETMWRSGAFSVEVVGAAAYIHPAVYSNAPPGEIAPQISSSSSSDASVSRNVLEVEVQSTDIKTPFSIIAWFPQKYMAFSTTNRVAYGPVSAFDANSRPNPYGQKRDVKVYSGDLRTRIDIVDEKEAEASFGKLFSKYFYVGRVYLRNQQEDKRLVVYTTSMRANVLLYRPPIATNSPQSSPGPKGSSDRKGQAVMNDRYRAQVQQELSSDQTNALAKIAEWQRIQAQKLLTAAEIDEVIEAAFKKGNSAFLVDGPRTNAAWRLVKNALPKDSEDNTISVLRLRDASFRVLLVWDGVKEHVETWEQEAARLKKEAAAAGECPREYSIDKRDASEANTNALRQFCQGIHSLAAVPVADLSRSYSDLTNRIGSSSLSSNDQRQFLEPAAEIYQKRLQSAQDEVLAEALRWYEPQRLEKAPRAVDDPRGLALRQKFDEAVAGIRYQASGRSYDSEATPFAKNRDILVNPEGRALAFSDQAYLQKELSKSGYLWRETYRPMTFQAVLNSLMHVHEQDTGTQVAKYLQSAAVVAGGMVGLSGPIHEFGTQGYLTSVNLFSTIFVPEVAKLIVEDLNKQIRNLGEMGMDTVVVIPPSDVVDHYVFFPKGPIYNFVDEFNVTDPAYIKEIDNDDLAVDATLIDQGVVVHGGGMDASALVGRALNEGKSDASAELLKQADLQNQLRRFELSTLAQRIQTALAGTQAVESNGFPSAARLAAETQVCKDIASFVVRNGKDSTGVLASLEAKFGLHCDDSPPTFMSNGLPRIQILAGVPSRKFVLPVMDSETALSALKVTATSEDASLIPGTNVQVILPAQGNSDPIYFTVLTAPNLTLADTNSATIDFAVTNLAGLGIKAPVVVGVHPPQIQLLGGDDKISADGSFPIDTNHVIDLRARVAVYDSQDSADWLFSLNPAATNGWSFAKEGGPKPVSNSTVPAYETDISIDGSDATTNRAQFTVTASYGANTLATTNVTLTVSPAGK